MQIHYAKLARHYVRLPRSRRILVTAFLCAFIFWLAAYVGEPIGKALYYLSH